MNVFDYIRIYTEQNNVKNYNLKSKFLTKNDIAQPVKFSGGVAFFYKFFAVGEIVQNSDMEKKFLELSTPTDWWDLSQAVEIQDFGTIQQVKTDLILTCDNSLTVKLFEANVDAMFSKIYNFCAQYIYMMPTSTQASANNNDIKQSKLKIDINY